MLTLILGPSGSGKSSLLRRQLKENAAAGRRSILIVPEQFTSSTEGALYRLLGDTLSGYVESYSFTSLAETLLRRYGGAAVPTLTEAGRAVLVRRALDSLLDKVVYYSRQRQSAAFCEKAARTIDELKSAGVTPDALAAYANAPGADRDKLSELALIYAAYQGLLANTGMDPGDRVELAAKQLDADFFAGRGVYIDEFDTFNASKRAMLAAMLPAADVTVALCCDGPQDRDGGMGLFSGAKRVAAQLRRMAEQAGVPCPRWTRSARPSCTMRPTAARRKPRPRPPRCAPAPKGACPTGAWRSSAGTPPPTCPPCGTSSAWRASRCSATSPPPRRTPPPPAPSMRRWTCCGAASIPPPSCGWSRPAWSIFRPKPSARWKTTPIPGRSRLRTGAPSSPAAPAATTPAATRRRPGSWPWPSRPAPF